MVMPDASGSRNSVGAEILVPIGARGMGMNNILKWFVLILGGMGLLLAAFIWVYAPFTRQIPVRKICEVPD